MARGRLRNQRSPNVSTAGRHTAGVSANSRQEQHDVLAYVPEGIALFDLDCRLVYCNEEYKRNFALSMNVRTPGTSIEDIVAQSDALREMRDDDLLSLDEVLEDFLSAFTEGGDRLVEFTDGRWMKLRFRSVPDCGRLIFYDDVTALVRAEQAERDSEERWNFALESAGQGVWDYDLRLGRTFYSRVWKGILGYEEHELGDAPEPVARPHAPGRSGGDVEGQRRPSRRLDPDV